MKDIIKSLFVGAPLLISIACLVNAFDKNDGAFAIASALFLTIFVGFVYVGYGTEASKED